MSGRIPAPSPEVVGMNLNGVGGGNKPVSASHVNAFRIAAVVDRLASNMQKQQQQQLPSLSRTDSVECLNLCLSLARGIDFSIANHEVPSRAPDLPILLKQVCQCRDDPLLQAAVMVLMISVKNACQDGWFSAKDSEDLNNLAQEIANNFCTTMDFYAEPSRSSAAIVEIMSRFYPKMKIGQILACIEVNEPGFGAYVKDFQISKDLKHSPQEKIRLFVAQTDSTETSSCLISPPKVNFLLNGKAVEKRNTVFMDTGPQMPTEVTPLLKYGSNLLQALGQFNGNYIIVVALMTELPTMKNATLQDYVQPAVEIVDPDSELIEGPSRISLNCPISFKRIKTPVKGQSCKHLQCFDFDNYININSSRPSWRCPHCNHHCCFPEIRIDQNIVKVLQEVGENVNDVIISSDGSWKAIMESNDHSGKQQDKLPRLDEPDSSAPVDLMDLTENDDAVGATRTSEVEDKKLLQINSANQSSSQNMTSGPPVNSTNEVQQSSLQQDEDNFWSGIYLSTFQSGTASSISDSQMGSYFELPPDLTDTFSTVPNSGMGSMHENAFSTNSALQSETTGMQLQPYQFDNSAVNSEHGLGRSHSIPQNVIRIPVAVQALPVQSPTTVTPRLRNSTSSLPSAAPQISASPADSLNAHMRLQSSRPHPNVVPVPRMSYLPHLNARVQSPDRPFFSSPQAHGAYQNSILRETTNYRAPHPVNQPAGRFHQSPVLFQGRSGQAVGGANPQHLQSLASAQRAAQATRAFHSPRSAPLSRNADSLGTSSADHRGGTGSTPQSVPRSDVGGNSAADQEWRPTGRMRGSLSGPAYSAAMSHYAFQPTQQAQIVRTPPPHLSSMAARAPTSANSSASGTTDVLKTLMANRSVSGDPTTGHAAMSNASGSLPQQSSGSTGPQ